MAQVDTWEDGSNATYLDSFYNVTMAVGPVGTAPNRRDDVLLVQYLFANIVDAGVWVPPKTAKPFQVNGRMGPALAEWIKAYQASKQAFLFQDGRIDRALGARTSNSQMQYTILVLNNDFQTANLKKFEALEDDAEAPAELRAAIKISRARGAKGLPYVSPGVIN